MSMQYFTVILRIMYTSYSKPAFIRLIASPIFDLFQIFALDNKEKTRELPIFGG